MIGALEKARKFIELNKIDEAFKVYQEILKTENEEHVLYNVYMDLGFLYYQNKQYKESIQFLEDALLFNFLDENGRINRILGFAYKAVGDLEQSVEHLSESLDLKDVKDDEYYFCQFELAKNLFKVNDLVYAEENFKHCEKYFRTTGKIDYVLSVLYQRGLCLISMKQYDIANLCFTEMDDKTLNPSKEYMAYSNLGHAMVAFHLKNAEDIIKYSNKVLELDKDFIEKETVIYFTIMAYEFQNRKDEYQKLIEHYIQSYPDGRYKDQLEKLNNN